MKLEDVLLVALASSEGRTFQKYLAFSVYTPEGSRRVIRSVNVETERTRHAAVNTAFAKELDGTGIKKSTLGGGFLMIHSERKTISVSGDSLDYGPDPDRRATVELLKVAYPDYRIEAV